MKLLFQSVRWRLLLWYSLILLVLITGLCLLSYRLASNYRTDQIDREIRSFQGTFFRSLFASRPPSDKKDSESFDKILERLRNPAEVSSFPPELHALFEGGEGGSYIAFWDSDGSPLFISANAPANLCPPTTPTTENPTKYIEKGNFREHHRANPDGIRSITGRDIRAEQTELRNFCLLLALGGSAVWLAGLGGGWWLAGRALKPIDTIGRTASRIAAGNLDERIQIANTDNELDRLGHVLNDTFERLSAAVERQKRFTADASHELRTPVTIILSETQRALKREREPEQYREILANCRTAAERMRALVESLLVLARQDLPTSGTEPVPCDLADITTGVADLLQPLADEHSITVRRELSPTPLKGDPHSLAMVVQNLLSNALVHPPSGSTVVLKTFVSTDGTILEVSDDGPGIAAEHLPRLFDRFYRADSARGQINGHTGLGLAIAKTIVENHGGRIEVESNRGTTFRVVLP
ncbi:ATP-binding protein [Luteolibacter flavescens]|uniref:histidine kinase n=1 Tax=Luteolibacter flavescens TaxID=1859460 RepID=A0ABT3FRG1_9BACT|nr:ATP-binding protein [Luteolibacter flavescens]MCW1885884.1 ATP-binding protein [Luteolibacter flavescens]